MKRATYAEIMIEIPERRFIKLMKYQTRESTEANAELSAAGETKPAISGTTNVITNVNNAAMTVNKINLS